MKDLHYIKEGEVVAVARIDMLKYQDNSQQVCLLETYKLNDRQPYNFKDPNIPQEMRELKSELIFALKKINYPFAYFIDVAVKNELLLELKEVDGELVDSFDFEPIIVRTLKITPENLSFTFSDNKKQFTIEREGLESSQVEFSVLDLQNQIDETLKTTITLNKTEDSIDTYDIEAKFEGVNESKTQTYNLLGEVKEFNVESNVCKLKVAIEIEEMEGLDPSTPAPEPEVDPEV